MTTHAVPAGVVGMPLEKYLKRAWPLTDAPRLNSGR